MFTFDGLLNQLNASTRRFVAEDRGLVDNIFQEAVTLQEMKRNCLEKFNGGRIIAENFWYAGLIGGAFAPGAELDITQRQVEQQKQFAPKQFFVNVTLLKEEIQVYNQGPQQIFSLVKSRMQNAYATMGAFLEIGAYLNGINANYTLNFNGFPEALNDNSTASWDGNLYANYGGISRAAVTPALNSIPINVNGAISLPTLETSYMAASFGPNSQPNRGVTTQIGYSLIKEKFQTQQRFNDTQNPEIGFNTLKFNNADLMWSRYVPGSYLFGSNGTADTNAVTYLTQISGGNLTAYPAPSGGYPAGSWETLWWLTAKKPWMTYYLSTDPEFGMGITGFVPAQGNLKVTCKVLCISAITTEPRNHKQLYGITG